MATNTQRARSMNSIHDNNIGVHAMIATKEASDTIYVAVAKDSKLNVIWAIQNSGGKSICIIHVHVPTHMIPMMGGKFPASALSEHQVQAHRKIEIQEMHNTLDAYLHICQRRGVRAEKLHIEMDCIEKGIVELISRYNIQNLVMGAASDKYHNRRMTNLRSKKAIYVREQAPGCCHIQFICKGYLIQTRYIESTSPLVQQMQNSEVDNSPQLRSRSISSNKSSDGSESLNLSCLSSIKEEDLYHSSSSTVLDGGMDDNNVYEQLEEAMAEAEKARWNAYQESVKRRKAEKDVIDSTRKIKDTKILFEKEVEQRKVLEEALLKAKEEIDNMRIQLNKVNEELKVALDHKMQGDKALREVEELRKRISEASSRTHSLQVSLLEFSFSEIEEATCNFNPSLKIGEGGYGNVFKGILRHTEVAIKMLNPNSSQGTSEFQQEVEVLSKLRHPNLITLIGANHESKTLVYEYLPNGSLEDRLNCKDNAPPLPWKTRIRIAIELCSALIFLHSNKPHCIVHGDLKPSNILLDANLVTKLSDFGICRVLSCQEDSSNNNSTKFWITSFAKGTFTYMDPEFFGTGEVTSKSDVYSFGIVLLRLLTGRQALGIRNEVLCALNDGEMEYLLDPLAGDWPIVKGQKLIWLALRCCDMNRKKRPELCLDVWRVLETMRDS